MYAENLVAVCDCLPSYEPFRIETRDEEEVLFSVYLCREMEACGTVVERFKWEGASCVAYRDEEEVLLLEIAPEETGRLYVMKMYPGFQRMEVTVYDDSADTFVLNSCLMLAFVYATASIHTLLMHASVVRTKENGYLFLGKSGTGKSTHSQLWLQCLAGVELLNDDNPVVRLVNGTPWVYGSPWSGKTPCYRNEGVEVGALLQLYQSPVNRIKLLSAVEGLASLMGSASLVRWDGKGYADNMDTLMALVSEVSVYRLDCLPDVEAARMAYETCVYGRKGQVDCSQ